MRTIAIGDIHGCRRSLEAIADYAGISKGDTIVTLGDYVDRGPDSKGVIEFLLKLRKKMNVVSLMGNHEIMMLNALESKAAFLSWKASGVGAKETLASYKAKNLSEIPDAHWEFIENGLPYYEIDTHFFVHANAASKIPLGLQDEFSLYWEKFRNPKPHRNGKIMVCGHTSQKSGIPINLGHAVCIDTWACGSGWLTALDVGKGRYWQANEKGKRRKGRIAEFLAKSK